MNNSNQPEEKTLIGVLASHNGFEQHESLLTIFKLIKDSYETNVKDFHFLITGGTYDRLIEGGKITDEYGDEQPSLTLLTTECSDWLKHNSTRLPKAKDGGVIILSYFISQHKCSIVWPFFSPDSHHWQRLENLAFMRLCDQCHIKRLMNKRSVRTWLNYEADYDSMLKPKSNWRQISFPHFESVDVNSIPLINRDLIKKDNDIIYFPVEDPAFGEYKKNIQNKQAKPKDFKDMTIALIAHNEMKAKMVDFAVDYEPELKKFKHILATGTTGREVAAATSKELDGKIFRYHSGPAGGDIEIATAVLYGLCDVVIFFIDPMHPHPHIEDIRVVFQACMMNKEVIIITNEIHAREFMARVVRKGNAITL